MAKLKKMKKWQVILITIILVTTLLFGIARIFRKPILSLILSNGDLMAYDAYCKSNRIFDNIVPDAKCEGIGVTGDYKECGLGTVKLLYAKDDNIFLVMSFYSSIDDNNTHFNFDCINVLYDNCNSTSLALNNNTKEKYLIFDINKPNDLLYNDAESQVNYTIEVMDGLKSYYNNAITNDDARKIIKQRLYKIQLLWYIFR